MVNSEDFERVRADICASGRASGGDNLLGMEMDAYAFLDSPLHAHGDPVPWTGMTIRRSRRGRVADHGARIGQGQ
jgi:hypothetical protein